MRLFQQPARVYSADTRVARHGEQPWIYRPLLYALYYILVIITDKNMAKSQLGLMLPIPVRRSLRKLGQDIRDARLRRRISTTVMSERASISRTTLNKIEKGDPGVSIGNYANVLFVLGMAERLSELADVRTDAMGLELDEERLPQRIRKPHQSGQKSKA